MTASPLRAIDHDRSLGAHVPPGGQAKWASSFPGYRTAWQTILFAGRRWRCVRLPPGTWGRSLDLADVGSCPGNGGIRLPPVERLGLGRTAPPRAIACWSHDGPLRFTSRDERRVARNPGTASEWQTARTAPGVPEAGCFEPGDQAHRPASNAGSLSAPARSGARPPQAPGATDDGHASSPPGSNVRGTGARVPGETCGRAVSSGLGRSRR